MKEALLPERGDRLQNVKHQLDSHDSVLADEVNKLQQVMSGLADRDGFKALTVACVVEEGGEVMSAPAERH